MAASAAICLIQNQAGFAPGAYCGSVQYQQNAEWGNQYSSYDVTCQGVPVRPPICSAGWGWDAELKCSTGRAVWIEKCPAGFAFKKIYEANVDRGDSGGFKSSTILATCQKQ